jgi:hypothetical protein
MEFEDQLERNNEIVGQMAEGNEVTNENLEAINAQLSEGLGGIEGKLRLTDNPDITLAEAFSEATMEQTNILQESFESFQEFMGDTFGAAFQGLKGIAEGQGFFDTIGGWIQTGIMSLFAGTSLWGMLKSAGVNMGQWVKAGFKRLLSPTRIGGGIMGWITAIISAKDILFGDSDVAGFMGWILDSLQVNDLVEMLFGFKDLDLSQVFRRRFEAGMEGLFGQGGVVGAIFGDELSKQINKGIEKPFKETWGYVSDTVGDLMVGDFKGAWQRTKKEWNELSSWFSKNITTPLKNIWSDTKSQFRTWSDDITSYLSNMPGRLSDQFLNQIPESLGGISDAEFFENRLQRQSESGASAGTLDQIVRKAMGEVEGQEQQKQVLGQFVETLRGRGVKKPQRKQRLQDVYNADNSMATGGMLTEPVFGVGTETGETYGLAEDQNELVTPVQGTNTQSTTTPETPDVSVENDMSGLTENMENTNSLLQQILNALQQQSNQRSQPPKSIGNITPGEQDQSTELIARGLM